MLAAPALPATTKPLPCGSRLGKRTDRLPFPPAQTRSQDGKETSPPTRDGAAEDPWLPGKTSARATEASASHYIEYSFTRLRTRNGTPVNQKQRRAELFGGINKSLVLQNPSAGRVKQQLSASSGERRGGTGQTHLHPMPLASQGPQEPTNQQSPFPPHQGHAGGETEAGTAAKPSLCWVQPPPAPHPQQLPAGPGPSQAGRFAFCCKSWMEMSRGQSPW